MARLIPIGARILVLDLEPEVSIVKRAQNAGLHIVVLDENKPQPTSGLVKAVGTDPLIQEMCSVGDTVLFSRHAGTHVFVEGVEYRSLELRDIAYVIKPDDAPTAPA
jgi:co-chaperonin GroES (HSP10)